MYMSHSSPSSRPSGPTAAGALTAWAAPRSCLGPSAVGLKCGFSAVALCGPDCGRPHSCSPLKCNSQLESINVVCNMCDHKHIIAWAVA